jgi:hypothetical protein
MSSDNINKNLEISGALSSLNIGRSNNESNDEEKVANNTDINTTAITTCAACGKEGDGASMNTCNKCDLAVYCNAACKKKHRSRHKKKCEIRASELFDERLFKEPPPPEDCPICMLPPPLYDNNTGTSFHPCCGKDICDGCEYAMAERGGKNLCPFCRTPYAKSNEEEIKRTKKLMEKGNAYAFYMLAGLYERGIMDLPQDWAKANELYLKAGELGHAGAYHNLGNAYYQGWGGEVDMKKAKYYYELAAMSGDVMARNNLGMMEKRTGNYQRACKHYIISARAGDKLSLDTVKLGYMAGYATKDQYANTLREYQKSQDEMKSEARDNALAARNQRMGV